MASNFGPQRKPPADRAARAAAVDPRVSVLVQAPAGSGKTTLLTERFLRLLPTVTEPDQVLAITFTRAAVEEMRGRVIEALQAASASRPEDYEAPPALYEAAVAALQWSTQQGWDLANDPQQLNIQTIDGLALQIAQHTPLTSRLGPDYVPTENAEPYYRRAALLALQALGERDSTDPARKRLGDAAANLLVHRDNQLQTCVNLLAGMLCTRDQWGRALPLDADGDSAWDLEVREQLEGYLRAAVEDHLGRLRSLLATDAAFSDELVELARFGAARADNAIAACVNLQDLPRADGDDLAVWCGIATLLLTDKNDVRKQVNVNQGFPPEASRQKTALKALFAALQEKPLVVTLLKAVRCLPPIAYSDEQWRVMTSIFLLLQESILQLKLLFAEASVVDFVEIGLAAESALAEDGHTGPSDLAFALNAKYRHVLVDEFQDTSRTHLRLLEQLLHDFASDPGRTVFVVGDPQQSIYLFRQAEMSLFNHLKQNGMAEVSLTGVQLTVNFRSQPMLVDRCNEIFAEVFRDQQEVAFQRASSAVELGEEPALQWHLLQKPGMKGSSDEKNRAKQEATNVATDLIEQACSRGENASIAVLVRVKNHARAIMHELRERKIPYRAIDMESLADRQEVLDVFALTRCLLHPADRVAWLSVLRAPWCGLSLLTLDTLVADSKYGCIADLLDPALPAMQAAEVSRAKHLRNSFVTAGAQMRSSRLPQVVWDLWRRLGGEACVNAEQLDNVHAYFAMLEAMEAEGRDLRCDTIAAEIDRLCAQPNPDPDVQVQLMTIHKAKGLEFDVVIVPQMDRRGAQNKSMALDWLATETAAGDPALYVSPVAPTAKKRGSLNAWICDQRRERELAELRRVLYVAATRARYQLHLLGSYSLDGDGHIATPDKNTLLNAGWCVAKEEAARALKSLEQPRLEVDIAAAAEVIVMPSRAAAPQVCHLPDTWFAEHAVPEDQVSAAPVPRSIPTRLLAKSETRAAGSTLHAILEDAARQRAAGSTWDQLQGGIASRSAAIRAALLANGVPASRESALTASIISLTQRALASPSGQWALDNHSLALTEFPIASRIEGEMKTLRLDRAFSGGEAPLVTGETHLWIIDYKSAAWPSNDIDRFLQEQEAAYATKMTLYAAALRDALHDPRPVIAALYFPASDRIHTVARLD